MMVLGYAMTGPALAGVMNGCKATPELAYTPQFFSPEQALTVSALAEIIMPRTDTPGAQDAGVPGFIDSMVKDIYSKEDQERFLKGLQSVNDDAQKTHGYTFAECSPEEQKALVKKYHDEAFKDFKDGGPSGWWNAGKAQEKPFILEIKELTLLGFFTSQPGATEVLQYNQVPGPFKGCVPLAEVGKTWAT
jgi:hypothetical protein